MQQIADGSPLLNHHHGRVNSRVAVPPPICCELPVSRLVQADSGPPQNWVESRWPRCRDQLVRECPSAVDLHAAIDIVSFMLGDRLQLVRANRDSPFELLFPAIFPARAANETCSVSLSPACELNPTTTPRPSSMESTTTGTPQRGGPVCPAAKWTRVPNKPRGRPSIRPNNHNT